MTDTMFDRVSVVIPTYNRAELLRETLASLLKQTYPDWEAIVVNNFSQDNTVEMVESFCEPRIRLVNFHNNGIVAASRNEGIRQASGGFIAFLDSDDLWHHRKLEEQIEVMRRHSACAMVYSFMETFCGSVGWLDRTGRLSPTVKAATTRAELEKGNTIDCSSVMIRRSALDEIGLLDENPAVSWCNDYDMWLRVIIKYPVLFIPRIHGYYRVHTGQLSNDDERMKQEIQYIKNKHGMVDVVGGAQERADSTNYLAALSSRVAAYWNCSRGARFWQRGKDAVERSMGLSVPTQGRIRK